MALGPELASIASQTFQNTSAQVQDGAGWNLTASGNFVGLRQYGVLESGKRYYVRVSWSGNDEGSAIRALIGGNLGQIAGTEFDVSGTHEFRVVSGSADFLMYASGSTAGDMVRMEIESIREIPGNHLAQEQAAERMEFKSIGGAIWLENDGLDDNGLQLASDLSVKMVALALQYKTGVETAADDYHTLCSDLAGLTSGSSDRVMLHQNNAGLFTGTGPWRVSVSGGVFGTDILPLPWSLVLIKRADHAAFNVGNFFGRNFTNSGRAWKGRGAPVGAFSEIPSDAELSKLHTWAQRHLGVA
ncbi:hypothetical protein [Leisingera sp. JC11]|uniref:hypothetical protein n=1 Tax=Leisingera sp. JC11 TaxID=3042469 RepID=UPI00345517BF